MKAKNILFGILTLLTAGAIGVSGYIIGRENCLKERNISLFTPTPEVISKTTV